MVKTPEIDFANFRDPFELYLTVVVARNKAALIEQVVNSADEVTGKQIYLTMKEVSE